MRGFLGSTVRLGARSRRLQVATLAAALCLLTDGAAALDCPDYPPPANFAARYETDPVGYSPGTPIVRFTWSDPVGPEYFLYQGTVWDDYEIEYRDDTVGGTFQSIFSDPALRPGTTWRLVHGWLMPVFTPSSSCQFAPCALPGHTYTFRMISRYRRRSCTDPTVIHDSVPSNEVQVTIPGAPPVTGGAPKDVIAVAETKKPRVRVSWKPGDGAAPTEYVIKRREVPDDAAKLATAGDFVEVARVPGKTTSYLDKTVVEDKTWEYVVEAATSGAVQRSNVDQAYTVSRHCPKAIIDVWSGAWIESNGSNGNVENEFRALPDFIEPLSGIQSMEFISRNVVSGDGLRLLRELPVGSGSSLGDVFDMGLTTDILLSNYHRADNGPPWALPFFDPGVTLGTAVARGTLRVFIDAHKPFDAGAFRECTGSLRLTSLSDPKKKVTVPFTGTRDSKGRTFETTLCATVGAGKNEVPPGKRVAILLSCVALGPRPLFARRAKLDVTLENATIWPIILGGDSFEVTSGPPDGKRTMRLDIGAIGPTAKGTSEQASLLLFAVVDPQATGQMKCTFDFVDDGASAPFGAVQPLKFTHKQLRVEVKIK